MKSLPAPGVPISEKISWQPIRPSAFALLYSFHTFSATLLSFPSGLLGASLSRSLASVPRSLASWVIFRKLSSLGSTPPPLIRSALATKFSITCFTYKSGSDSTIMGFPPLSFGTSSSNISEVWISATSLKMFISSGRLVNLLNRLLNLNPLPSTVSSSAVVISPKFAAQESKWYIPICSNACFCKYNCITYISHMVLEIGVPVANTIPLPPLSSVIYWHLSCISVAFFAPVPLIPDTLFIFENMDRFLKLWASSTIMESIPNSSNVIKSSFELSSVSSFNCCSNFFFWLSICFTVQRSPFLSFISSIAIVISSICSFIIRCFRSDDIGIFSNCEWDIIMQS